MPSDFIFVEIVLIIIVTYILLKHFYQKFTVTKEIKLTPNSKPLQDLIKSSETYKGGVLVLSPSGEVLYWSKSMTTLLGIQENINHDALQNAKIFQLPREEATDIYTILYYYSNKIKENSEHTIRAKLLTPKDKIPIKIIMGTIDQPKPLYVVSITDMSDELQLSLSREKDQLTNLPNQNSAIQEIGIMISKMHAANRNFALILTSLDNFSSIRAMLGHHKTDRLIKEISEYLSHTSAEYNSSLYQVTRNNFLLAVPDISTADQVKKVVKEIESKIQGLQTYSNSQMHLTFSTGVSLFPFSGHNVDHMVDSAYKALSSAEEQGGGYLIIDDTGEFSKDKHYEAQLYNEMYEGLKHKEFELYYQPFIDMKTDKIVGAEALIRWNHPKKGLVPPGLFIPVAEKSGLIVDIGKFVIEDAIKQQKKWEIFKFNKLQISINLTLREIEDGEVVNYIEDMLNHHQVDPKSIKFEITENVAMVKADIAKQEFDALKALGVHLALDDFGTGYSSFGYLKDFKLDTIKIDQSFVMNMLKEPEHQKIVRAMIGIGHNFNLQVTAEGIENKETYEKLKEFGCDIAQGYYFSKPIPVFEFQELIRNRS